LLVALTCVLVAVGCSRPQHFTEAQAVKWVRDVGDRLVFDAKAFYESIPADMPEARLANRIAVFLAAESRFLTLQLVEDAEGRPVGLVLRPSFWDRVVAPQPRIEALKRQSRLLVAQVLVALGVQRPANEAQGKPLASVIEGRVTMQLLDESPLPLTTQLRSLHVPFPHIRPDGSELRSRGRN
jgi:hypothetical protein